MRPEPADTADPRSPRTLRALSAPRTADGGSPQPAPGGPNGGVSPGVPAVPAAHEDRPLPMTLPLRSAAAPALTILRPEPDGTTGGGAAPALERAVLPFPRPRLVDVAAATATPAALVPPHGLLSFAELAERRRALLGPDDTAGRLARLTEMLGRPRHP